MKRLKKFLIVTMVFLFSLSFSPLQFVQAFEDLESTYFDSDFCPILIQEAEEEFVEALLEVAPDFDLENLYFDFEESHHSYEGEFPDRFVTLTPYDLQPLSEEAVAMIPYMRCASCTHFVWTRTAGPTIVARRQNMGWHPSFPIRQRVSGYWLSTSRTVSWAVSLGVGVVSVEMGANGGGSGHWTRVVPGATGDPWTRPRVIADVSSSTWRVQEVLNATGRVLNTSNRTIRINVNSFLRIMVVNTNGVATSCNWNC